MRGFPTADAHLKVMFNARSIERCFAKFIFQPQAGFNDFYTLTPTGLRHHDIEIGFGLIEQSKKTNQIQLAAQVVNIVRKQ